MFSKTNLLFNQCFSILLLFVIAFNSAASFASEKSPESKPLTRKLKETAKELAPQVSFCSAFETAGQMVGDLGESTMKNYEKLAENIGKGRLKDAQKISRAAQRIGTAGVFLGKALIVVPAGLAFLEGSVGSKNVEKETDLKQIKDASNLLVQLQKEKGKSSPEYEALRNRLLERAKMKEGDPLQFVKEAVLSEHSLYGARCATTELLCGLITKSCTDYIFKYFKIDHTSDLLAQRSRRAWKKWDYQLSSVPLVTNPYVKQQQRRLAGSQIAKKAGTYVPSKLMNKFGKGKPSYSHKNSYSSSSYSRSSKIKVGIGINQIKMTPPSLSSTLTPLPMPPKIKIKRAYVPRAVKAAPPPIRVRPVARPRPVVRAVPIAKPRVVRLAQPRKAVRAKSYSQPTYTRTQNRSNYSSSNTIPQKRTCGTCGGRGRITRKVERKESEWFQQTVDAGFNPDGSPVRHKVWKSRPITKYEDEDSWCSTCSGSGKI